MEKKVNAISLQDNNLIIPKAYLKDSEFVKKLSNGICALFSFVIAIPKILVTSRSADRQNLNDIKLLIGTLNYKIIVDNFLGSDRQLFCKAVHNYEYDLGIIFSKKSDVVLLEFVSGSGQNLSDTKMSIIKKYLNLN